MEEQKTELKMIRMSEVESQEVKWLWYPFIPYGKLTIIQGDPGDGKTTLVLNIAAKLSKGECLDSDMDVQEPVNVIYQTAEDGLADTVKPRLEIAGADCEKILVIDESDKSLSMADERLEEALAKTEAKVLILDPIQAYLGGGMDMNRANEARDMTKKLGALAEKYQCAILLIGHMNKASGKVAKHIDFAVLSNLELLKNRLIYVSTLLNVADADKSRLRRDINECWKKIYHILRKSKERVLLDDEFLVTHFMLYFAKNIDELEKESYTRRYDHLGQWQSNYLLNDYFVVQKIFDKSLTIEDCFNYIQSLSECIDFWGDIKNPLSSKYDDEIKEYIDKINFFSIRRRFYRSRYMIDFSYLNVFLLACFRACNNNNKTLLNFLKILEKYLFSIEFYDGEAIEELCINLFNFAEAVVKLNKGEWVIQGIIDKLKKLYESLVNSTELNKKTVLYYSKNGFYRTSWLRYFLCEYEYSLMKKSKTNINKLNRWEIYERGYNSIEHIYPENSHNKYWIELFREYTSKQKML